MGKKNSSIKLFLSNRLENLAEALIENIERDRLSPMQPEVILVQSRGMARWLNLQRARRCGIQLNSQYVFPRVLIDRLIHGVLPDYKTAEKSAFNRDSLKWFIFENLPSMGKLEGAEPVRHYLEKSEPASSLLRRYLLAEKMAYLFDQHQVYRPDLLEQWESSPTPEIWRAACWKYLRETIGDELPYSGAIREFGNSVARLESRPHNWPTSLHIFGISSLPPVYLNILREASRWMPCLIYLTQPSPQYWGDFTAKRHRLRRDDVSDSARESPLLGNLGRLGQDFMNLLIDNEVFTSDGSERFSPPEGSNLLIQLQRDLYEIAPPPLNKREIKPEGIQVRICHSPKREIEVLKNQLRAWFEEDNSLTPDQIVVMAPDIEVYTDVIMACFADHPTSEGAIPFAISDRSATRENPVAESFLCLLRMTQNRLTAREVFSLLTLPVFASRFSFTEQDWPVLDHWLQTTAIRWGLDARHRQEATGVSFEDFSWRHGVDNLVAGYCFHPSAVGNDDFENPYPDLEGNQADLLNRFLEFWEFLESRFFSFRGDLPPGNWVGLLRETADLLFQDRREWAADFAKLRTIIADFDRETSIHRSRQPVGLDIVIRELEQKLRIDPRSGGFFSGGITFCSMRPMRNIPVRKIALIGMDESSFPRRDFRHEFNTFSDHRRLGDRSMREDDRYLFLESILSAREELYLSYCGIDAKDLTSAPPSTIVEELLDHLDEYYTFPGKEDSRAALVIYEHLQPFNPHYFTGSDPPYDGETLKAAKGLIADVRESRSFVQSPLPEKEPLLENLPLDSFIRFFQNPSRFWLRHQLGLGLPHSKKHLEDAEPIDTKGLNQFMAMQSMIRNKWQKEEEARESVSQYLPVGAYGSVVKDDLKGQTEIFVESLKQIGLGGTGEPFEIDLKIDRLRLRGQLQNVTSGGYLVFRYAKLKPQQLLAAWLEHLALCASLKGGEVSTYVKGKKQLTVFPHVEEAPEILESLEKIFLNGIRTPQPIFPQASYYFAKYSLPVSGRSRTNPLKKAEAAFLKTPGFRQFECGDGWEPHIRLCFPDVEAALCKDFEFLAKSVHGEMLNRHEGDLP